MRRGHSGNRGWRNENPRHFRPRGGGMPQYMPSRGYGPTDGHRFPQPGPRPYIGGGSYNPRPVQVHDNVNQDHHTRNKYHNNNRHVKHHQSRGQHYGPRHIFPLVERLRHGDVPEHNNSYKDTSMCYDDHNETIYHINNFGDVDHRQSANVGMTRDHRPSANTSINREPLLQHPSPWANPPPCFEDKNHNKPFRSYDNSDYNKIPVPDYEGHRPPSSDHYGGSAGSSIDNSNTFSRSVDDTVDIIRKRLQRRESQHTSEDPLINENDINSIAQTSTSSYENVEQGQPIKKKTQKQRQNVKVNCDKIKTKIVHQLFMMDKDKIHKLMDNPNSSSKFEFAISSLVTESQNSFNRHLRSVAEQSLCSSSTDFIHNDNNTIYEDTFMKQMQCILDPQDTILLEDIKPMVLAELSKVLQLDDFEPVHEMIDEPQHYPSEVDKSHYDNFSPYACFSPTMEENSFIDSSYDFAADNADSASFKNNVDTNYNSNQEDRFKIKPLYSRRDLRLSSDHTHDRRSSIDNQRSARRSIDNKSSEENFRISGTPTPLFNTNTEQLSDDDDPFAELDKQYHVAVDHNFIENDDLTCLQAVSRNTPEKSSNYDGLSCNMKTPKKLNIKEEIDTQQQNSAKSPTKSRLARNKDDLLTNIHFDVNIKKESHNQSDNSIEPTTPSKFSVRNDQKNEDINLVKQESPEPKNLNENIDKNENTGCIAKSASSSSSRKRSIDQRPSHRKEKRKKSEPNQTDTNKQILNKNIIINVNDCAAKLSEKCDAPKSIFNLFFSKEQTNTDGTKENKKGDSVDRSYSDKYVKRKESKKPKSKDCEGKTRHDTSSSSNSILSPTGNSNTNNNSHAPTKVDGKTKLTTIDMFGDQQKKANVHQAHRNTAPAPAVNKSTPIKTKPFTLKISRKVLRRHVATQVIKKSENKEIQTLDNKNFISYKHTQTERKKTIARGSQTDPVSFKSKSKTKALDSFERMKEIDMEIQVLLQEKFKLYNSMETKESCPSTLQSLGMAVLNVNQFDEAKPSETDEPDLSQGTNVEEFKNIPTDDLEQTAIESVQKTTGGRKSLCKKVLHRERGKSKSPTANKRSRKGKGPNISLIEQIIEDDRPLEDIISLDDLETTPTKSKKKSHKSQKSKKKSSKKAAIVTNQIPTRIEYDIKDCSVQLVRIDIGKYVNQAAIDFVNAVYPSDLTEPHLDDSNVVEGEVENAIQFDMLDVSEDIVIGDVCEVKSLEDKDINDPSALTICEDIILDNSQSATDVVNVPNEGNNENECKMYDFSADENLRRDSTVITGNGDAVLAIECVENNFIAACLDGNVYYFNGNGQMITTLRGSNLAVTCLTIVKEKYGTTVYTGSLDSRIRYFDLETGLEKGPECNVLSPIQTMDRAWDTIFVGTRTGFVLQFECKNNMLIPVSTVKFSEQSILALRAMKEGPRKVLLVAARSEPVTIKDAQTGLLLRTLEGPKMTVYTLLFEDGKVFCGTSGHQIHVFDYASGSHVGAHEGGKGAVCLRATGGLVFAGCYDGCIYVYREGEPRPLAQLRGPSLMLLSLAILGTKIIAGYKDRSLYMWKIPLAILQEMIL